MPDIGINDFGGGLSDPALEAADGTSGGVPSSADPFGSGLGPFGSGLFGRQRDAFANRPQLNTENPVQDRINALTAGRRRLQQSIDNPLRAFLKPRAWQEDVQRAAEFDGQIQQTQQALQNAKDNRETATNLIGVDPARAAALGVTATEKTMLNAAVDSAKEGRFAAARGLLMSGDQGKNLYAQNEAYIMPSVEQNNAQAEDVINKLNMAAQAGQPAYAAMLGKLRSEGVDPSKVLSNYVPGMVVPDKADAWAVRGKSAMGALAQAKQLVTEYNTKQSQLGLGAPEANKDAAEATLTSWFAGSMADKIPGAKAYNLSSGEKGAILPPGSIDPDKNYGRKGSSGYQNFSKADRDAMQAEFERPEVKGALDKANASLDFYKKATNDSLYTSAAGITTIYDGLSGIERNVIEGSKGSANASLTRQFERNLGPVDQVFNHLQQAKSAFDAKLDSWVKGGKVGPQPRLDANTIDGLKQLAKFQNDMMMHEVHTRIGGALDVAGYNGARPDQLPLAEELQNSLVVTQRLDAARQKYIDDVKAHKYVNLGTQAVLLPQTTNNPGAKSFPEIKDAAQVQKERADAATQDLHANTVIRLESSGKAGQVSGSHAGLAQGSPEWNAKYGVTNPDDPVQVKAALAKEYETNETAIQRATGIIPTDTQNYLAHQQGIGGIVAHMSNPDAPAWLNMASTLEGRQKGEAWAKQAVWGNVPSDMKHVLASNGIDVNNLTSGDFMKLWDAKFEHVKGAVSRAASAVRGFADRNLMQGVAGTPTDKRAASTAAINTMSEAAPIAGGIAGATGGFAVGGPVGAVAGGAAGSAAGQTVRNAVQGAPLMEGVPRQAALGAVTSVAPARPVVGALMRSVGTGAVEGTNEALTNPGATPHSIFWKGAEAGAEQVAGEGLFRVVGMTIGRAGAHYNDFNATTQQKLTEAGAVIAKGKPEAPKPAAIGVPVSATDKAAHETELKKYEDAVDLAKSKQLDPEDLAHAVTTAKNQSLGQSTVQLPIEQAKRGVGAQLNAVAPDINRQVAGVGTPPLLPETVRYYHGAAQDAPVGQYNAWMTPHQDYAYNYGSGNKTVHYVDMTLQEAAAQGGIDQVNGNRPRNFQANAQTSAQLQPLTSVATPKTTAVTNGPLSLVGKPGTGVINTPDMMARMTQAENDAFRPAQTVGERYQNIFDARSNLIADANGWKGGTPPDENTRRALMAAADNLGEHQRTLVKSVYGKNGEKMADHIEELRTEWAKLSNLARDGDIVGTMARQDAKGAEARALFQKYAKDDPLAQRFAKTLVRDRQASGSGMAARVAKYATVAALTGLGIPGGVAAILAGEMPAIVNGWMVRRAAGGPSNLNMLLRQRAATISQSQQRTAQLPAAAAGRIGRELLPQALQ